MKSAIQFLSYEQRDSISITMPAPYYVITVSEQMITVVAVESDGVTSSGNITIRPAKPLPINEPIYSNKYCLPKDAFLLGVTMCLVDGEPFYFLGKATSMATTDDRQNFIVAPASMSLEDTINTDVFQIVNDIDNDVALLAPVLDAQALYQPSGDED